MPHTLSNVGVLQRIIFSHTPDEAMSGGLVKACVSGKNCSVSEKIEFLKEKCHFRCTSIPFFGEVASREGVQLDPQKVKALTEMSVPQKRSYRLS